ncbi:ATP-grasp fold amidoligase family protein [Citricoccus sp. CH26A]|uniref:ATP-grasp fold amidoligase family protein n=1 Tax=Citricoccus TaxID=169133 RepID=UPI0009FDF42C|nr:ATP-grasp fold amidoligase family protein [Citricoccus sp. CH26A]
MVAKVILNRPWLRQGVLTNVGRTLISVAAARTVVRPDQTILTIRKWYSDKKVLPLRWRPHFLDYLEIHHAMKSHVGRFPNLVNPEDFNDKIQWLKLFDQREETVILADKVRVRDWVAERIGPEYLIPVIQIADHPRELDRAALGTPPYVVKASHDSGSAQIVRSLDDDSWAKITKRLSAAVRRRYGTWNSEWPYRYVRPRVIVEEFIGTDDALPVDYKFNCVNGEIKLVRIFWDRGQGAKVSTVYEDGTQADIRVNPDYEHQESYPLPPNWSELCALARKLAEGIPFVRVDLYSTGKRIYFGEMTFLPQGGLYRGGDQRALGDLTPIDLTGYREPIVGRIFTP